MRRFAFRNGHTLLTPLLAALVVLSVSCDLSPPKGNKGRAAVAGCDPDHIKYYAARYSAQLVFDACGINNFRFFRWSPDGNRLFFQTPAGPFVLNGQTRHIDVLPVPSPSSTPLWLTDQILAYPHIPKQADQTHRIDFFDIKTRVNNQVKLKKHRNPRMLQPTVGGGTFYFIADQGERKGRIWRFKVEDGSVQPAFGWLDQPVEAFSYHPKNDLIAYRVAGGEEVVLAKGKTGKRVRAFPNAKRATFSTDATWMLVEETGGAKRLESAHNKSPSPRFVPDIPPRRVYLWNLGDSERVDLAGLWGYQGEWYPGHANFSLILQGFDEHYYNPNILLVDVDNFLLNQKLHGGTSRGED